MPVSPEFLLRLPRYDDVVLHHSFLADPEVAVWLEDRCQRPVPFHHVQAFVLGEAWYRLAIEFEGRFVGMTGLEDYDAVNGSARFFIIIGDRRLWRCGLGSAVIRRVVDSGFHTLGLRRITSNYLAPNLASRAIHERAGFCVEGCQRQVAWRRGAWVDQVLVGLLREDRLAARAVASSVGGQ